MNRIQIPVRRLVAGVLLILLGVGLGWFLATPLSHGGGGKAPRAPNAKWWAIASTARNSTMFGAEHTYYDFVVQTVLPHPLTIRKVTLEAPTEVPMNWRKEGTVTWAPDSSSVTFQHIGTSMDYTITLRMKDGSITEEEGPNN